MAKSRDQSDLARRVAAALPATAAQDGGKRSLDPATKAVSTVLLPEWPAGYKVRPFVVPGIGPVYKVDDGNLEGHWWGWGRLGYVNSATVDRWDLKAKRAFLKRLPRVVARIESQQRRIAEREARRTERSSGGNERALRRAHEGLRTGKTPPGTLNER